jgi:hypothetical protein
MRYGRISLACSLLVAVVAVACQPRGTAPATHATVGENEPSVATGGGEAPCPWPAKGAAVSLTYDDAIPTHLAHAAPDPEKRMPSCSIS